MWKIKDCEQVKHSLRGKRVKIVSSSTGGALVELLEDTDDHYKTGDRLLTFPEHLEEEEE